MSFKQSYKSVADLARLEEKEGENVDTSALQDVKNWLQNEQSGPWLMILDNADDVNVFFSGRDSVYEAFLPKRNRGNILVTSRSRDVALRLTNNNDHCIKEISTMDESQAMALFRGKASRPFPEDDIKELLKALGYIPLAITQAVAFLNHENGGTPAKFLKKFRESDQSRESLLSKDYGDLRRDHTVSNSVVVTWQLTFDQMRRQTPSAADLLSFMSCFKPQSIPTFILKDTWRRKHVKDAENPDAEDDSKFTEDIRVLLSHSLVSTTGDQFMYEMHPLVSFCTGIWLSKREVSHTWLNVIPGVNVPATLKEKWSWTLLEAMEQGFPDVREQIARATPICEKLVPHIESIVDAKEPERHRRRWARVVFRYAVYLRFSLWRSEAAEIYFRKAYNLMKETHGEKHLETREALGLLGDTLGLLGSDRLREAEILLQNALQSEIDIFDAAYEKLGNMTQATSSIT